MFSTCFLCRPGLLWDVQNEQLEVVKIVQKGKDFEMWFDPWKLNFYFLAAVLKTGTKFIVFLMGL